MTIFKPMIWSIVSEDLEPLATSIQCILRGPEFSALIVALDKLLVETQVSPQQP